MTLSFPEAPEAPEARPVLGHLPQMAHAPLPFLRKIHALGPPLIRLRFGPRDVLAITSPQLVHRVLVDNAASFAKGGPIADAMARLLGNSLVTCPESDHPRQRRLMNPAFGHRRMPDYAAKIRVVACEVADSWQPGQTFRLEHEAHRLASLAVSRSLVAAPAAADAARVLIEALPDLSRGMYWHSLLPGPFFARLPLPVNRRYGQQMGRTREAVDRVVAQYRTSGEDYEDVLSKVIPACAEEADPQQAVFDQVLTILFGGVETTAASLAWTLRLLHQHPDVADQLHAELKVLDGRPPSHEDLDRLPYTRAVVLESIRLHPPAWLGTRVATDTVRWEEGTIPAGTSVAFSPYALHRSPVGGFADPDVFDPLRWCGGERAREGQNRAFVAFGAGSRKCIGDTFAINELMIAVAVILSRWDLDHHWDPAVEPTPRFIMSPPPTPVTVKPRR